MDFATPHIFTNAKNEPDENDMTCGQKLEIQLYEARYNSEGKRIRLRAGTKRSISVPKDVHHESALISTIYYDIDKEVEYSEMEVRSPYIRTALRTVIKEYPGLTFDSGKIVIRDEPRCIFHYRNELREYGVNLADQTAVQHLVFFLNYMYNSLTREISSYYTFMESPNCAQGIEHEFLWMAFKPGELIYYSEQGIHRILKLTSMRKTYIGWNLTAKMIAYDGETFGYVSKSLVVRWYDGYKPLEELRAYPLRCHSRKEEIHQALVSRGQKYLGLRKASQRYYSGVAQSLSPFRLNSIDGEEDYYTIQSFMIRGRIIVDTKKFGEARPTHKVYISSSNILKSNLDGNPIIPDDELCMFDSTIPGFSFSAKRWCFFELDRTAEIDYNTRAFESLVLPEDQKKMILSLVRVHSQNALQFDDLIKGKGKGIVFLLHGKPGVGKTLTAESIADYTQRPLYTISSGDLGITAPECERALVEILDLATCWNAILLIDEADVFLEERSHKDLQRNGLVSVFLRLLEYYEGIMFLTSNRLKAFDTAFKSRIHLAINYPGLSDVSQQKLWTTFLTNDFQRPRPLWLTQSLVESLTAKTLNGRQIKNVVRTASAMALAEARELRPEDIQMSLKMMSDFEADFPEGTEDEQALGDTSGYRRQALEDRMSSKRQRLD